MSKNVKNPYIKQLFPIFEGLSKTVTNITNPNMEWFKLEIATFEFGDQMTGA
jgi:hypothetical protein